MRFLPIILTVLVASACATVEPPYRGKLSDAMNVASDEYSDERHLEVPQSQPLRDTKSTELDQSEILESTSSFEESSGLSNSDHWEKSIMITRGSGRGLGYYQDQSYFTIRAGGENKQQIQSEIYLGVEGVSLNSGSSLYQSIDGNLNILFAGVGIKYLFQPYSEMVRPYLSLGAGGAYMFWSYRNAFTTSDGDLVTGDNLSGFTISTAVGVEIKPVSFLSMIIEANPKIYLWDEQTGWGFDNNEFDPLGLIGLTFGVSILF